MTTVQKGTKSPSSKPSIREYEINTTNKTRFYLSFHIEAGQNPLERAHWKIQEFLKTCHDRSDKSTTIIPWEERDIGHCPIIEQVEDIPKHLPQMKIYLPRLQPTANEETIYIGIFLGHDCPAEELKKEISVWLDKSGFELFILKKELDKMGSAPFKAVTRSDRQTGMTPINSEKEVNATPSSKQSSASPEKRAGGA